MKNLGLLLMLISLVPFSACNIGQRAQDIVTEQVLPADDKTNSETPAAEPEKFEKVSTVSSYATEEFLIPLDDYSWEMTNKPEYVMLHFTSAVVPHPEDPFNLEFVREIFKDSFVSIHYIIDRDGKIHCWLPETRAAWHAGKGTINEDDKLTNSMNKYSIGIEMLAIGSENDMAQYLTSEQYKALDDSFKGYTDEQYQSLKLLVADICQRNGIPQNNEHIIGHEMYNPSKSDPGELFDWSRLFAQ